MARAIQLAPGRRDRGALFVRSDTDVAEFQYQRDLTNLDVREFGHHPSARSEDTCRLQRTSYAG